MKVKDLIKQLNELDPECTVILQGANEFIPAGVAGPAFYTDEDSWNVDIYYKDQEDIPEEAEPCVVIFSID